MTNAVYSNARARSLEKSLLGAERINRMIDSGDPAEAMKILAEVNFGGGIAVASANDFEILTNAEEKNLIAFIKEACPSKSLKAFLLKKYDYHNAEALIKSKYLKTDSEKFTVENGLLDKDEMREKIMSDDYRDFPEPMKKALAECDAEFAASKASGASINAKFIKAYFADMAHIAKKNGKLSEIYKAKVDSANISTALRTRNFAVAKQDYLYGGTITLSEFKALNEEQFDVLKTKFRFSPRAEMAASAIKAAEKKIPLSEFEKEADEFAVSYLLRFRYATEGVLPFMQYCFYKLADIANVRIIMVGLLNGFGDNIKSRLRTFYAG